ncbi:MAG: flagellar filament capping protein FliD [Gammaproteobacteria bacterium]
MLSTPGVGSGLDISTIINQLMAIERQPLIKAGTRQIELEARLSAFGKLKSTISTFDSAMSGLKDADKFKYFKANSSDTDVLSASAGPTAARGRYTVDVVRIAENHRLAAATVFADADTTKVGNAGDKMTITVGSTSFEVEYGDMTLDAIRDAINEAGANQGVTASLLQDDDGYHLTLAADDTGSDNLLGVTYSAADDFGFQTLNNDRDGSGGFNASDLDAVLTLENTFTVTRSSNAIADVIGGVTLTLVAPGAATVTVARDTDKVRGSVNQFIGVYNEVVSTITKLRSEVLSDERASLLSLESQFRAILNTKAGESESFDFLFELGVSTQLDGTLSLDATVFDKAYASDPEGIADMFANADSGLATRLSAFAGELTGSGGMLASRETTINGQIRAATTTRANIEARLARKEASLVEQFSALDALLASLNTTSNFLTTQLDQIAAVTKSSNGG